MGVDFWNQNLHPVTMFSTAANTVTGKYEKSKTTFSRVLHKDFDESLYIESTVLAAELKIGVTKLSKQMRELGHFRICTRSKKFYLHTQAEELRKAGVKEVVKSKLDLTWMVTAVELAEKYEVKAWQRFKIVQASGLKPVMRHSGNVYFDKEAMIPYFEAFKMGTLITKPRSRK